MKDLTLKLTRLVQGCVGPKGWNNVKKHFTKYKDILSCSALETTVQMTLKSQNREIHFCPKCQVLGWDLQGDSYRLHTVQRLL